MKHTKFAWVSSNSDETEAATGKLRTRNLSRHLKSAGIGSFMGCSSTRHPDDYAFHSWHRKVARTGDGSLLTAAYQTRIRPNAILLRCRGFHFECQIFGRRSVGQSQLTLLDLRIRRLKGKRLRRLQLEHFFVEMRQESLLDLWQLPMMDYCPIQIMLRSSHKSLDIPLSKEVMLQASTAEHNHIHTEFIKNKPKRDWIK